MSGQAAPIVRTEILVHLRDVTEDRVFEMRDHVADVSLEILQKSSSVKGELGLAHFALVSLDRRRTLDFVAQLLLCIAAFRWSLVIFSLLLVIIDFVVLVADGHFFLNSIRTDGNHLKILDFERIDSESKTEAPHVSSVLLVVNPKFAGVYQSQDLFHNLLLEFGK